MVSPALSPEVVALRRYCLSLTETRRLPTREVVIGGVAFGGTNPIRVQSMTTTDTLDTQGTVAQAIRMIEAGCELVRITAPSIKEAENLRAIKHELRQRGYPTPLVADIHFTPNAAELAARIVEKVRVNPGNYADKKQFKSIEYTDATYQAELERIEKRFSPLVQICKDHGTAMRIGTNHGSLSDRILSRYGDTPLGMVESALEFVRICEAHGYFELVISMKASNPQVMVQAYRLLAQRMLAGETRYCYPLHLGVTEAGDGEDGRIKSALGIGALLVDGIGDTVRVSLTEPPEREMPVGRYLVNSFTANASANEASSATAPFASPLDPYSYRRRATRAVANFGGENVPRVIVYYPTVPDHESLLLPIGHLYDPAPDKWTMFDTGADYLAADQPVPFMLPNGLKGIYPAPVWQTLGSQTHSYPWFDSLESFSLAPRRHPVLNFVSLTAHTVHDPRLATLVQGQPVVLVAEAHTAAVVQAHRAIAVALLTLGLDNPLVLACGVAPLDAEAHAESPANRFALTAACQLSSNLVDGLADGLWLFGTPAQPAEPGLVNRTSFNLLQLARLRTTKTEYISCPSCGRTLFDLEETTARIRARTEHLKGVKIGIMGCIVNGPGEMADADYGYVGAGPGVISLWKGQTQVKAKVPTDRAVDELIALIRAHGDWVEPQ
ncbi:MAG: (E)-4-hydroxy-3-methylbut-2-enyl-diphosphate synthase [Bacteroidia bacterium]|nr:(E)-4-hydroxy-3-methylbut-2-enyl-diphosphate synthase [Bacteroidia bacterium]